MRHSASFFRASAQIALALLATAWISGVQTARGQATAFTYQGRLNDNGRPANGQYDFIFLIFDAVAGGSSLGGSVNATNIPVSSGLFTVGLDFGGSPFSGPRRWLQISVSTNAGGSFETLAPRQEITRAPYATYANTAAAVATGAIANAQLAINSVGSANIQSNAITARQIASGQVVKSVNGLSDSVSITQGANVTINTVGNSLQISAPAGGMALPFSGAASSSNSVFTLSNSGTGAAAAFLGNIGIGTTSPNRPLAIEGLGPTDEWISFNVGGTTDWHINNRNGGWNLAETLVADGRLFVAPGGNVGIGTDAPSTKLDVRGDIVFGASKQLHAASGEESLRIVRGVIAADGHRAFGSGFASERLELAKYLITFSTPFSGTPSVTATAYRDFSFPLAQRLIMTDGVTQSTVTFVVREVEINEWQDGALQFIAVGPR